MLRELRSKPLRFYSKEGSPWIRGLILEANIKDPQAEASFLNATTSFLVARIMVGLPSVENKEKILRNLLAKEKVEHEVEFKELATMTEGYTGSDLKNLCTNATYRPVRELIQPERLKSLSWEFHVNQAYNQNTPQRLRMSTFKDVAEVSTVFESCSLSKTVFWDPSLKFLSFNDVTFNDVQKTTLESKCTREKFLWRKV
ncbi:ATPase family AAA domain-containing protein 1-A [Glycine soja]